MRFLAYAEDLRRLGFASRNRVKRCHDQRALGVVE
jgi:hypothetical protein